MNQAFQIKTLYLVQQWNLSYHLKGHRVEIKLNHASTKKIILEFSLKINSWLTIVKLLETRIITIKYKSLKVAYPQHSMKKIQTFSIPSLIEQILFMLVKHIMILLSPHNKNRWYMEMANRYTIRH